MEYMILARRTARCGPTYFAGLVRSTAQTSGLLVHFESAEFAVLFSADAAFLPVGKRGALIIGTLFDRSANRSVREFSSFEAGAIGRSGSRHLLETYWGAYIAITFDTSATTVLRDPSGGMPCLFVEARDFVAVSSSIDLLVAADLIKPKIDTSYLALHLTAISLRPPRTALLGIQELLRGQALEISSSGIRTEIVWNPWTFALKSRAMADRDDQAESLREVVVGCTGAWAKGRKILLDLSGGLDSSIVAASLAQSNADFTCLSFITSQASGDERPYARDVASHLGAKLVEVELRVEDVDLLRSSARHLPRPTTRSFLQAWDLVAEKVAADTGADAFFNGAGGDNVFCFLQSPAPVADQLLVHGPGKHALETAIDLSRLTGCSVTQAFLLGARRAWLRSPRYRWPAVRTFLPEPDGPELISSSEHPWFAVPRRGLPGSAAHIALLLQIENHLEGYTRSKAGKMHFPLLSQPIVEHCLAIPSWEWCRNGLNRSVARAAFRSDLPVSILRRRDKGSPESFLVDLFERRRHEIREILGDGLLAEKGLIDRDAVLNTMIDQTPARGLTYSRILRLVDVEAWLQHWSRHRDAR